MQIKEIKAREILDSRGYPTIACDVTLSDGHHVFASVPAGKSVGSYEAFELRDNDPKRFNGKGVLKAINNINHIIAPLLINKPPDFMHADQIIIAADGTHNKSHLGANALLAVSMAVTRAQAYAEKCKVYELLNPPQQKNPVLPLCMFNILNGGLHANNGIPFQEFMIMLNYQASTHEMLNVITTIYHTLQTILEYKGYVTTVGDEGGFAPIFTAQDKDKNRKALDLIMQAIEKSGFQPGKIVICLDVAASHLYNQQEQHYIIEGNHYQTTELIALYENLTDNYPIFSIEDGLSENDWQGWNLLTKTLKKKIKIIGDDLFVTNTQFIEKGIIEQSATGVIIKPNQIGTISQAIAAQRKAHEGGLISVASHRSGETNDSFITDFAVGTGSNYLKAGACARGERVAKYNRLLEIELAAT